MKIKRIIITSNNHPNYINYWPLVAHSWKSFIPTLFFIGNEEEFKFKKIEGTEVYFLKSIPEISSCHYARIIRILVPILFPDDVCLTTDIDILPLTVNYFINKIKDVDNNNFVLFTSDAYPNQRWRKPLCYLCGKGSTYASIINIDYKESNKKLIEIFNKKIKYWYTLGYYCATDEYVMSVLVNFWYPEKVSHISRNANSSARRIEDRTPTRLFLNNGNKINMNLLRNNKYIDVCLPKPFYDKYNILKPILKYLKYNIDKEFITQYGAVNKTHPDGKHIFYKTITCEMKKNIINK
jgi:hypothetical protein